MANSVKFKDQLFGLAVSLIVAAIIIPIYLNMGETELKKQLAQFGSGRAAPETQDMKKYNPTEGTATAENDGASVFPMFLTASNDNNSNELKPSDLIKQNFQLKKKDWQALDHSLIGGAVSPQIAINNPEVSLVGETARFDFIEVCNSPLGIANSEKRNFVISAYFVAPTEAGGLNRLSVNSLDGLWELCSSDKGEAGNAQIFTSDREILALLRWYGVQPKQQYFGNLFVGREALDGLKAGEVNIKRVMKGDESAE